MISNLMLSDFSKMKCIGYDVDKLISHGFEICKIPSSNIKRHKINDQRPNNGADNTIYRLKINDTWRFNYWLMVSDYGLFGAASYSNGIKYSELQDWAERISFRDKGKTQVISDLITSLVADGSIILDDSSYEKCKEVTVFEDHVENNYNFFVSSDRKGLFTLDGVRVRKDVIENEPCISINGIRQGWGCAIYMDRETAKRVANEILEMLGGEDSIHDYRRKLLIELDKLIADHEKVALDYPDDQALKISTELKIHREELIESLKGAI